MEARKGMDEHTMTNVIALGDNMFEIEAAHVLGSKFTSSFIKTVKFRTGPSPNELIKQLNLVLAQFDFILFSPKNLTVRLLKSPGEGEAGGASGGKTLKEGSCDEATLASTQMMANYNKKTK